jgi:dTMP kinase
MPRAPASHAAPGPPGRRAEPDPVPAPAPARAGPEPEPGRPGGDRRPAGVPGTGRLVAFEGVEGAGKSTQLRLLGRELAALGFEVVVTREPGGTPLGERVRELLLDPASAGMHPRAEALLFAAARAQLVEQVIRPAIERGAVVLCDRYLHSSLAYQGAARGLGVEAVAAVNRWGTGGLPPDVVVLLDLDPSVGLARRSGSRDRIEDQELEFHRAVGRAFRDLAAADPDRFVVVDARQPVAQVAGRVRAAVLARLEGRRVGLG